LLTAPTPGTAFALTLAGLMLIGGCARMPNTAVTPIKATSEREVETYLLQHRPDLDQFRPRGPFAASTIKDLELRLSATERVTGDLYLPAPAEKAPLVILVHGNENAKEDHSYQGLHLATWGIHCLALQLPNTGPWVDNGRILARVVAFIQKNPQSLDSRIDTSKIILAGHSFGGYAVAIALAEGAPAAGGILLDPATVGNGFATFFSKINKPVMVLGADEQYVSAAQGRSYYYRYIRSGIAEVSIRGAAHEDAEFSLEPSLVSNTTEEHQITFMSALTGSVFSLAATGKFDYAWSSFGDAIKSGRLANPRKK
jgi:pimeloyl-ACP methyl ester carboxylesterase